MDPFNQNNTQDFPPNFWDEPPFDFSASTFDFNEPTTPLDPEESPTSNKNLTNILSAAIGPISQNDEDFPFANTGIFTNTPLTPLEGGLEESSNQPTASFSKRDIIFHNQLLVILKRYDNRQNSLKSFTGSQDALARISKYIKCNKNTFSTIFNIFDTSLSPSPPTLVENAQNHHKWINSLTSVITNLFILWIIHESEQSLAKYIKEYEEDLTISSEKMPKKNLDTIETLKTRFENDKKKATFNIPTKSKDFAVTSTSLLIHLLLPVALKTAANICKSVFNIFKNIAAASQIRIFYSLHNELNYRLHPQICVNIYPDNPTFAQQKLKKTDEIAQQKLRQEEKEFINELNNCKKIEEVQSQLKKKGISFKVPSMIDEFKRQMDTEEFKRELLMSFHSAGQTRPVMNEGDIEDILINREMSHNDKIEKTLAFLDGEIQKSELMEWDEIRTHFAELKIPLDAEHLGSLCPGSKDEWLQLLQDRDNGFLQVLAQTRVEYHETVAQLVKQGVYSHLDGKLKVERNFLHLSAAECIVDIVSNIFYLILQVFEGQLFALSTLTEIFLTDICKMKIPGIQLLPIFHPLYRMPFKVGTIALFLIRSFFASRYKPNEYSLKAYGLTMYMRIINLSMIGPYLLYYLKLTLLVIKVRLIENQILRRSQTPLEIDPRYLALNKSYEQKREECDESIRKIEMALDGMRLQDAHLTTGLKSGSLKDIDDALKDKNVDPSLFPEHVIDHFQQNLCGFKLTSETKEDFKSHLENLLSFSEDSFMDYYASNRFAYLKN